MMSERVPLRHFSTVKWIPEELQVQEPFNPKKIAEMIHSSAVRSHPEYWINGSQAYAFKANQQVRAALEQNLGLEI